ncbi:MAG: PmoA family protein [Planctomycetota bacterium]
MPKRLVLAALLVMGVGQASPCDEVPAHAPLAVITVQAAAHPSRETPVSAPLDGVLVPLDRGLCLVEVRDDERLPVSSQIEPGAHPRLWWVLSGLAECGERRVFELVPGDRTDPPHVTVARDPATLRILHQGDGVLAYQHAVMPPPAGASPRFARSGFIHPLYSPAGEVLTRIHPPDHVHHLGLWNPWPHTRFEGREVDFWNLDKGQGTVRFVRFVSIIEGPVFGGFRALHDHVDLTASEGEKTALSEVWDVRVWSAGGSRAGLYLVDLVSTLACATSSPVRLLQYRYGGLGFRAAASFDEGDYLTSEGKRRADGQGTRARWCLVGGPTAKGPAGVLFMSHPHNHEHPEPMRIWSDQRAIFFGFCPVQAGDWQLEPGKEYVLRYRLCIYGGALEPAQAEQLWEDWTEPPLVEVRIP